MGGPSLFPARAGTFASGGTACSGPEPQLAGRERVPVPEGGALSTQSAAAAVTTF